MGNEEDIQKIGRKLDKIVHKKEGAGHALDMLKALKRIPITLEIIQKTSIGKIVNNLRKSVKDEEVQTFSKSLIKSWKKLLAEKESGERSGRSSDSDSQKANNNNNGNDSQQKKSSTDNKQTHPNKTLFNKSSSSSSTSSITATNSVNSNNANTNSNSFKAPVALQRSSSFPAGDTTDGVRMKCRELIAAALKCDDPPDDGDDPDGIAAQIETSIYNEMKATDMKYKNRVRSRVANLKDKNNPDLRLNVLRGAISPNRIAVMTADEMASAEMKELRQKFTKEAINDHQMAVTSGTKSDLIKCPACKKSNATYNQVQTRSADEPMTTFCLCNECGKRWRFC